MTLASAKVGMHAWSYSNDYSSATRTKMTHADLAERFSRLTVEVELGFTAEQTAREVERCLNCDIQTHFTPSLCIECDACIDVCPVSCLTIAPDGDEADLRARLSAPALNPTQPLFVSPALPQTRRVMVKDEDVCLHCGLCAERCPTAAWDMRRFEVLVPIAGRRAGSGVRVPGAPLDAPVAARAATPA
jgi:ferredoxin